MEKQTISESTTVTRVSTVLGELATEFMRSTTDAIMRVAREHELSMPTAIMLMYLHRSGPVSVSAVAEYMAVSLAAASQKVDHLVGTGLVTRSEDPTDRRTKLVALTVQGQRFIEELRQVRVAEMAQRLAGLPEPQLESVLTTIEDLMAILRTRNSKRSD